MVIFLKPTTFYSNDRQHWDSNRVCHKNFGKKWKKAFPKLGLWAFFLFWSWQRHVWSVRKNSGRSKLQWADLWRTWVTILLHTIRFWLSPEENAHTTASEMPPSLNRRSSDFSPQNCRNSTACEQWKKSWLGNELFKCSQTVRFHHSLQYLFCMGKENRKHVCSKTVAVTTGELWSHPTCPFHLSWLQCTYTNRQCTPRPCPFHLAWLPCTCTDQMSLYNHIPTLSIPPRLITMYPYRPMVNVQPHPVHSTWPGYNVPVLTNCQCTTPPCPFHLAWLQCTCTDQLSMYNPTLSIPPGLVTMYLYRPTVNVQPHPVHSTWPGYNVPVPTNSQCTTPPCPFHLAWLQCTCTDQLSLYNPTLSIPPGLVTRYLFWPTTWGGPESMGQILPAANVFCVNPWCASQAALSATLSSREHGQRNVSNKWRQWGQRPRSLTSGELAGGPRSNSRNELLLWCKRPNVKVQSLTRAGGFSVTDHCTKHKAIMIIFILHPLSQMNKSMAFSSAKRVVSN